jgi:hypothetical protein
MIEQHHKGVCSGVAGMQVGMSINTLWNGVYAAAVAALRGPGRSHIRGDQSAADSSLVSWVSPARSRREDELARRSAEVRRPD